MNIDTEKIKEYKRLQLEVEEAIKKRNNELSEINNGLKVFGRALMNCPSCGGTGKIISYVGYQNAQEDISDCCVCDGTGYVVGKIN